MTDDSPEGGIFRDLVSVTAYEAPSPLKKRFRPWHRPRKQLVRDRQWRMLIEGLVDEIANLTVLKYLGLPGTDLLDLRYFHTKVCEPRHLGLSFLGFNNAASPQSEEQTELNISLDEVRKLSSVDPQSDVVGDDFQSVANKDSIAWQRVADFGPFNVINLDLCDGIGAGPPSETANTHFDAIMRLLSLQARSKNPWLLLITTRVGSAHVHGEVLERLLKKYSHNLNNCADFVVGSTAAFKINSEASLREAIKSSSGLMEVFVVSLCKWILSLAIAQNPRSVVEVKSVIGYNVDVNVDHPDLISIALQFRPTFDIGVDPLGLAQHPHAVPDECTLANSILAECQKRYNADTVLAADAALRDEMTNMTADLLELARYEASTYRGWIKERSFES